jgi:hypothetical protein
MSKRNVSHKSKAANARPSWLLPLVAVVAVVVVIGAALALSRSSQPKVTVDVSGKPNLVVDKSVIDFGDVQYEKPVTAVFTVSNTGDQPLQLLQQPRLEVLQGCCPPQAVASSTILNPGETGTISVRFTMHEGMGGQHEFLVHLLTNDPAQAETQLRIFSNWIA